MEWFVQDGGNRLMEGATDRWNEQSTKITVEAVI